jgi:PEP-CTERM/exosortase A-associated glycosyltransferase
LEDAAPISPQTRPATSPQAKSRSYRVLHILDHSWPVMDGYSQRSRCLITAQSELGLRPCVLTSPLHQQDDPHASDTSLSGLRYFRTPDNQGLAGRAIHGRWPLFREISVVRLLTRRIEALLNTEAFDIIHAHSPSLCGLAALRVARSRGIPFVYELRAFWEDAAVDQNKTHTRSLRYALSRKLEDYVVHRADALVGISQSILDELNARGANPARLFHVPNGVDTDKFSPISRDDRLAAQLGLGKEPVLGYLGSLFRWEGVAWLVGAVAELRRRGTPCKLLVIGDGEEMPAIRAAVRELDASEFIQIVGRVSHDDIKRYYSVVDVLVYPRHSVRLTELVTPLKPLEGMALGKAILGSDVGGIRELIEPEQTGLLFRADNVDDFCKQAQRLIGQETLRRELGMRARKFVLREKDWKILAQRYVAIYDAAAQNDG